MDVAGVQRTINIGLLDDEDGGVGPGWVLIHVGFAMSRVDEDEALATRRQLERMGQDYEASSRSQGERHRMSDCGDHCITCSDEGIAMQVERVDVRRDSPCASARTAPRAPLRSRLSSRLRRVTACSYTRASR